MPALPGRACLRQEERLDVEVSGSWLRPSSESRDHQPEAEPVHPFPAERRRPSGRRRPAERLRGGPNPLRGRGPNGQSGLTRSGSRPVPSVSPRGDRAEQVEPGPVDSTVLGRQGGSDEAPFVACRGLARGWRSSRRWPSKPLGVAMARVGGTAPRFFLVILSSVIFGWGCSSGSSKAFEPR